MGKTLSTIAIIQARLNSIRFPNKVMQKINGKPLIEILIERVASAKEVNKIVVATSVNKKNKKLIEFLKRKKYPRPVGYRMIFLIPSESMW